MLRFASLRPAALRTSVAAHQTFLAAARWHGHSAPAAPEFTPEEQRLMDLQAHRGISKSVPGKLFMLNYLSQEQSATSITNRILSVAVVLGGALGVTLYGQHCSSYSVFTTMLFVIFPAFFMYVHMGYWQLFPLVACGCLYAMRRY